MSDRIAGAEWLLLCALFCFVFATIGLLVKQPLREMHLRRLEKARNPVWRFYLEQQARSIIPGLRTGAIAFYLTGATLVIVVVLALLGVIPDTILTNQAK